MEHRVMRNIMRLVVIVSLLAIIADTCQMLFAWF